MPIFVSKFSQARSLVGNFLFARSQGKAEEAKETAAQGRDRRSDVKSLESGKESPGAQQEDRVELSGRQNAGLAEPAVATPKSARPGEAADARGDDRRMDPPAANERQAQVDARSKAEAPGPPSLSVPLRSPALGNGTMAVAPAPEETAAAGEPGRRLGIREENVQANRNASVERLDALRDRLSAANRADELEETPNMAVVEAEQEEKGEMPAAPQPQEGPPARALLREEAQPAELPPRETQEQRLQQDVQTIASGLRADAAIESQQNVEQTARNTQAAAEQGQRSEMRENQMEIRALQAERRQLQMEASQKDQAIRQLQSRTSRLQGGSVNVPTFDVLAQ